MMNTETIPLPIPNFLWHTDRPGTDRLESGVDLAASPDPVADLRPMRGHFAIVQSDGRGNHVLARDRLGVNKLFFTIDPSGGIVASNYVVDLLRNGHCLDDVWSVPSGHVVSVSPQARSLVLRKYSTLDFAQDDPEGGVGLDAHVRRIGDSFASVFEQIRSRTAGRPLYVTLSGGLDSTAIAMLTREWIGPFTGITFHVKGVNGSGAPSEDLEFAGRVARRLGVEFETVSATSDTLVDLLDVALVRGQDWRDFNVHCALVNTTIAAAIARRHTSGPRPVVLTGDGMNELFADYAPVPFAGQAYYAVPRLPAGRLRRFLVSGLDSGDREVGVFNHYGVDVIQPYALCAHAFTALPDAWIERPGAKSRIVRAWLGSSIPDEIYERPKVRAQVGSSREGGGVLAALVRSGIDQARLKQRFAELSEVDPKSLDRLIRGGLYRFTAEYPK